MEAANESADDSARDPKNQENEKNSTTFFDGKWKLHSWIVDQLDIMIRAVSVLKLDFSELRKIALYSVDSERILPETTLMSMGNLHVHRNSVDQHWEIEVSETELFDADLLRDLNLCLKLFFLSTFFWS